MENTAFYNHANYSVTEVRKRPLYCDDRRCK